MLVLPLGAPAEADRSYKWLCTTGVRESPRQPLGGGITPDVPTEAEGLRLAHARGTALDVLWIAVPHQAHLAKQQSCSQGLTVAARRHAQRQDRDRWAHNTTPQT